MDLVEVNSQCLHLEDSGLLMSYLYTMYEHRKPLESFSLMIFTQKYMPQFSKTEHVQLLGFLHYLVRFVCVTH